MHFSFSRWSMLCGNSFNSSTIRDHEYSCQYREYLCMLDCYYQDDIQAMYEHLPMRHHFKEYYATNLYIDTVKENYRWLMIAYNEFFDCTLTVDSELVAWSVRIQQGFSRATDFSVELYLHGRLLPLALSGTLEYVFALQLPYVEVLSEENPLYGVLVREIMD